MTLRGRIEKFIEKITNKECKNCKYNKGIVCESPKRELCCSSIFPKGYEPKTKGGSDMDGYISKKALLEFARNHKDGQIDANDIARFPCADVVPKSEVENLIYKLEGLLCHSTGGMLSKYSYDFQTMESAVTDYINKVYYEGYDEAKAEVAREIFEEIEEICVGMQDYTDYAELKKKYTQN